ncbi:hypothetical protein EXT67_21125 [Pectobacterium atrosepticum]|uniref:Uncharacterized protein n=1 Tax=Pectobacterium phage phiTE TaxID=1116482 RepID=K9L3X4_9CAUD|nr:hypothetical protein [Pectobacterium atrosepticum]YP_007392665.1 virion structural protein [Pectobacterium phage phiTE]AEZ66369.1 hypothetical protein phiTE_203 [Pectobacterium phage phiTE]MCL6318801.1 hypothetical protein [Pectobacterium atrosepticum]MCL6408236.1 hypothetical protein [Dickeya dadantii]
MNELLLIGCQETETLLFNIPPVEGGGSKTVMDVAGLRQFNATGSAGVVGHAFGNQVLGMESAGGHFENLSNVDFAIGTKPFELKLDMYLWGYPSTEGAIFSQLSPSSGGGTFGLTMARVTNVKRLAFFFTSKGSLSSRQVVVADRDVPLLTPVNVRVKFDGKNITIFMDDVNVGTIAASRVHSEGLPVGIGGHYGTNSYNMNGMLKNITITKFQ